MNRFVIIVPFYNVGDYIIDCYRSILSQTYTNWIVMFGDDGSTDNAMNLIPNFDSRFIKISNEKKLYALANEHNLILSTPNLNQEDIIIILDGDDKLLNNNVLSYLNDFYTTSNPLVVYGQYTRSNGLSGTARGFKDENEFNNIRQINGYFLSHIRTWKYRVYQELVTQDPDLTCYKDLSGQFYKTAADVAIMYPLIEIAGYKNVKFNHQPLYWYRLHPNNDHILYLDDQKNTELEIKMKPKFKQII